ncbi:hypothetical protein DUI87_02266 [Hirundo rustica rustica]|uniref:Core shell protein Gag P30 domain-containing protein n=1 Tax=Hirundo rustica rustica TaxID=333673 RepID=A0A3M0L6U5_HIRRU|nr:hypothetical protein DUI87_02266 [Hirundo rustica rustica]
MSKKDETPTEWLDRLRKSLQIYSGTDLNSPIREVLLKTQFVAKSWDDIRRKLEKIDNWQEKGLQELLREAQKVYMRRDEENQKIQARILVTAVKEVQKQERSRAAQKADKWLTDARLLKYEAILIHSHRMKLQTTTAQNSAQFLFGDCETLEKPAQSCAEIIDLQTKIRPDLEEEEFEDGEKWFMDRSARVVEGKRKSGYATVDDPHKLVSLIDPHQVLVKENILAV